MGRALEVFSRLSQDEAMDYERLKLALLKRYDFTEFSDTVENFVMRSQKDKKALASF